MDSLGDLKAKLAQLKEQISSEETAHQDPKASETSEVWIKLNDIVTHLSPEQIAYINSNKELINKKAELNAVFNEWLFEKYKNEFTKIPQFEAIARDYVNCVEQTSRACIQSAQNIMKENEQLRSELEELKKKLKTETVSEVLL